MCSNFYQYIYQSLLTYVAEVSPTVSFTCSLFVNPLGVLRKRNGSSPHILFLHFPKPFVIERLNFKPRLCKKEKNHTYGKMNRRIAVVVQCLFEQENFRETAECDVKRATGTSALTSGLYLGCRFSMARGHRAPTARASLLHNRAETSGI